MLKKGFAHLIPLLAVALLLVVTGFVGFSISSDNAQKKAVGKVLSDQDEQQKQVAQQAQETSQHQAEQAQEATKKAAEGQKQTNGSSAPSVSGNTKINIDQENGTLKIKAKNGNSEFESEGKAGSEEAKLQTEGFKVEVHQEGDKLVTQVKDKNGKDVDLEASQEAEILDQTEKELENDDIKIATGSAQLGFIQKGNKVRTNFPLSVNPQNGDLLVTTPEGEKVVTILPDQAIDNMIKAGVITKVETQTEPTPSIDATSSSQSVVNAQIELTVQNNQPVYVINGVKDKKFIGLIPVSIRLQTVVSSKDGNLVAINEDFLSRLLSLVSF